MLRTNRDLLRVQSATVAALVANAIGHGWQIEWLTGWMVLPLALIYPGYALVAAAAPDGMDAVETAVAALGMSLVCVVLGGVILHLMPWGIQTTSWVILLTGVTLIASVAAAARGRHAAGRGASR